LEFWLYRTQCSLKVAAQTNDKFPNKTDAADDNNNKTYYKFDARRYG